MRDPNRIDVICDLLRDVWKQVPDWRLGQLIFNFTGGYDCFYVEDDTLEEALKRLEKALKRLEESSEP